LPRTKFEKAVKSVVKSLETRFEADGSK